MSLSELVYDLQVTLNTVINLGKEMNDKEFIDEIKGVAEVAKNGVIEATGVALHRLHKPQPSIDIVTALVKGIPEAMSHTNKKDRLPIQTAREWEGVSVKYIPILAKEGIRHNVGGRGMRGGLFVDDPEYCDNWNILELLVNDKHHDDDSLTP